MTAGTKPPGFDEIARIAANGWAGGDEEPDRDQKPR
jgi:hypothetical protein